jgi:2-aminobenzoate-CoA ligase
VLNCADQLLDRWIAEGRGDHRCVMNDTTTYTYRDLWARANRIAAALTDELGMVPGNRVLLRGPNNPEMVAAWFGVIKAGGVAVATMPLLRSRELRTIGEMAQVQLALCDERFSTELSEAALPGVRTVSFGGSGDDELSRLAAGKSEVFESVRTSADDVCMLAFTSGTTGRPKATMHFHRDVLAIADTFSRHVLRPVATDLFIGSPPLAFTFGLGGLTVFPMHAGAATFLVEQPSPDRLLEAIGRHGATVMFTAPTAYRALTPLVKDADIRTLRRCVSAGETLPASTWQGFHDATGIPIIDGIGSTEMLHIFVSAADGDIRPGSTGRAVPGYRARVVDPEGNDVADGEVGLLAVQGPTGCRYLDGDRQENYVRGGWNYTGDAYVRDAEGYFRFQARADDMIISAGYNIAGPEVEEALLRHPAVAEAGVVGVPDELRTSIVKAFVVLRPGFQRSEATAHELQDFVKAEIAPYKYPREIDFLDALPRTETGKLQRFRLRQPTA